MSTDDDARSGGNRDAELAERLARISAELKEAAELALNGAKPQQIDSLAAAAAFKTLGDALLEDEDALARAHADLNARQTAALESLRRGETHDEADKDPRFASPDWSENPFYDYLRRMFLETSDWAQTLTETAPGLSDDDRRKARFFLKQAAAALAPSNYLSLNARALNAFVDTAGDSLEQGVARLKSDLSAGGGRLSPRHVEADAFQVGETLATTPGEVVFRNELIELLRYFPATEQTYAEPLLIFPPWINKYYVLDLRPDRSLAEWLVGQGFTVYIVSWRSADPSIAHLDWDDYIELGAQAALDLVSDAHDAPVHAVGYCVGGTLLATFAAYLAKQGDDRLATTTFLAAQTDFSDPGELGLLIDVGSVADLEQVIGETGGVMPGEMMIDAFNMLRPEDLIWRYVEESYLLGRAPKPFDVLYWNADQTNIPGKLHLTYLRKMYLDNALANGRFVVRGTDISLADVGGNVFVHAAESDHISPFASVYRGARGFGGDVNFILSGSGHIAGVVNPPSAKKYAFWSGPAPQDFETSDAWRDAATKQPGSWWTAWAAWLEARSSGLTAPPSPLVDAEPAPGRYVLETLEDLNAHIRKDG